MTTYIEHVTPALAKEYLKHNIRNRPVKVGEVESIARDIKNGDYKTTHQGIAFDTEGILIDGQQRLLAVLMADSPIDILVSKDVPSDCCFAIDRGVSRSLRDTMVMGGYGDTPEDQRLLHNSAVLSTMNQLVECAWKKRKASQPDAMRLFNKFRVQIDYVYRCVISKAQRPRISQVYAAAIAALYAGVDPVSIARFFNVFYDADVVGCEDYNIRAVLNWRRTLDDARARRVRIDRKKIYLGTQNAIYHFVNNTDVHQNNVPSKPRYDIESVLIDTLGE